MMHSHVASGADLNFRRLAFLRISSAVLVQTKGGRACSALNVGADLGVEVLD